MKIQGKEIVADEGKYLHRIGSDVYFTRCSLLPGENESNFEEVSEKPDSELSQAKNSKIAEITAYDTSSAVNEFLLNNEGVWLDKDTRVGLMNSTQIEKAAGNETTTLWLGTQKLIINCDTAIQMLSQLELYALKCFNKTAEHKANVLALTSKEEVESYDFTTGYPEKLQFSLEE